MTHLTYALLAASLISVATATGEDLRTLDRLKAAAKTLFGCAFALAGGGWLMRLIHG